MLENVTPLKKETLQALVHQRLCDLILQGEIAPGESVTVASIAKALMLVRCRARSDFPANGARGADGRVRRSIGVPLLGVRQLEDLRKVRSEIEASAIIWAVANRTPTFEAKLEACWNAWKMRKPRGRCATSSTATTNSHFAIYAQAGSALMLEIISTLWLRINPQFHLLQRHGQLQGIEPAAPRSV